MAMATFNNVLLLLQCYYAQVERKVPIQNSDQYKRLYRRVVNFRVLNDNIITIIFIINIV